MTCSMTTSAASPSRTGARRTTTTSPGASDMTLLLRCEVEPLVTKAIDKTMILFDATPAPPARCRWCWPPARRHPAPRGDRPRHGGRLQPQEHVDLLRQDRQAGREAVRDHRRRRHPGARPRRDQRRRRGQRSRARPCSSRTASSPPTCTTASRAKHYGVEPTGNGRRESTVRADAAHALHLHAAGPHKKDEIIASVKKGIYCETFTNGQVNIGAGDFTFYVKNGWLIEDGKLTAPIKDVNIIGNGPKVLELSTWSANDLKIDEGGWTCGKDGQSVPVSQGMPTVRVASITVGGRAEAKRG
jgi:hypothetical protein